MNDEEKEKEELRKVIEEKTICPDCRSRVTYYRLRSQTFVCRHCGHIWELVEEEA